MASAGHCLSHHLCDAFLQGNRTRPYLVSPKGLQTGEGGEGERARERCYLLFLFTAGMRRTLAKWVVGISIVRSSSMCIRR